MGNIAALNMRHKDHCSPRSDDESMHVGKRLKRLMNEKGISTESMAQRCGVTPGAVSNWFSTGHIARENLVAVADELNESIRFLITGDARDRALSEIEAEFAKRDVSEGTRESILTLIRSSPLRPRIEPDVDQEQADADAEHFRRSLEDPGAKAAGGRQDKKTIPKA